MIKISRILILFFFTNVVALPFLLVPASSQTEIGRSSNVSAPRGGLLVSLGVSYGRGGEGFLYDAARTGLLGPIVVHHGRDKSLAAEPLPPSILLRAGFDDGDCRSHGAQPYFDLRGLLSSVAKSREGELFVPRDREHDLLMGNCVVGTLNAEVRPFYRLDTAEGSTIVDKRFELREIESNALVAVVSNLLDIWKIFEQPVLALGLWSRDGMKRSVDPNTDEEIIQGIQVGGAYRDAALTVLLRRMDSKPVGIARGGVDRKFQSNKPTSEKVAKAVLDENFLRSPNNVLRRQVIFALLAIGSTAYDREVYAQILDGLESPIRNGPEEAYKKRINRLTGQKMFTQIPGEPSHADLSFFELSVQLVNQLDQDHSSLLVDRYIGTIRPLMLRELARLPHIEVAVGRSNHAEKVVSELLSQIDVEVRMRPVIEDRIKHIVSSMPSYSTSFGSELRQRCTRRSGFFPNGRKNTDFQNSVETNEEFCARLLDTLE